MITYDNFVLVLIFGGRSILVLGFHSAPFLPFLNIVVSKQNFVIEVSIFVSVYSCFFVVMHMIKE